MFYFRRLIYHFFYYLLKTNIFYDGPSYLTAIVTEILTLK